MNMGAYLEVGACLEDYSTCTMYKYVLNYNNTRLMNLHVFNNDQSNYEDVIHSNVKEFKIGPLY